MNFESNVYYSGSSGSSSSQNQSPSPISYPGGASPDDPALVEHGRVLDLICEGPIYGLATGDLKSIFLDGVPVQNADGSTNLKDVYFAVVNGGLSQPAIKGMTDVESETTIQTKVTAAAPVVATITNALASACRVKVSVPALYSGSSGTTLSYLIEVNDGSGWVTKVFPPSPPVGGGSTLTLAVNATAKTITRNTGSFITDGYRVGQVVRTYGFANSGNNQSALIITTISATVVTCAGAVGLVTETAALGRYLTSTTVDGSLKGRFTSKYIKAYRFPLTGSSPWQIRLTRITADSGDPTTLQNDLYFESITSIVEARLSNPYVSKVAVSVDAKQYNRIPARAYLEKLLLIQVPKNYDPVTRVYATTGAGTTGGVWDGTFKTAWSDNPAWCFYDLATNARYGAGASLDASKVDKWSLYTIGQYCDVMVDDGNGGTEPRFTCNVLINSRQEGIKLLNYMASVFRGMAYWASGVITAVQDVDSSAAALFTSSNVVDGKFSYSGTARRARHTACTAYWNDPNNRYKRTPEYVEDQAGIARYGLNQVEVTAFACSSQGQARRLGLWTLASELTETETVSFATGMEGVVARPGEIIQVQDQFRDGVRSGGRIVGADTTGVVVTLDSPVTIASGVAYQIYCTLPTGAVETRIVTTGVGTTNTLTVSIAFTTPPQVQGQWVLIAGDDSVEAVLYRIISINESEGVYSVTALLHNSAKYTAIETGLAITPGETPDTVQFLPVTNLAGTETLKDVNGTYFIALNATWTPQAIAIGYSAFCSLGSGPWIPMTVSGPSAELTSAELGVCRVRVFAHYQAGISDYAEVEITDSAVLGASITGLTTVFRSGHLWIVWDPYPIYGMQYEVRKGTAWASASVIGIISQNELATQGDGEYWIAPRVGSIVGIPATITITGSNLVANVVQTYSEDAGWLGTLSGGAVVNAENRLVLTGTTTFDELVGDFDDLEGMFDALSGLSASGEYEVPASHIVDIGISQPCTITSSYTLTSLTPETTDARLYIAIAGNDEVFGDWVAFAPGQFYGRKFKMKVILTCTDLLGSTPVFGPWSWTVDMPDRVEVNTALVTPATGTFTWTYARPFMVDPNLQLTIIDTIASDTILIDAHDETSSTFHITNGGSTVSRIVNALAQGY